MDLMTFPTTVEQVQMEAWIGGGAEGFSLNQLMIQNIASVVLSGIFLIASSIRLFRLRRVCDKNVNGRNGRILKLVSTEHVPPCLEAHHIVIQSLIVCYGVLKLLLLVSDCLGIYIRSVPAAALSFADVFFLGALSYVEHSRSRKPSTILGLYLFFSIVIDCIPTRLGAIYENSSERVVSNILMIAITFKAAILILELREKIPYGTVENEGPSPEETIGTFNRLFYFWLNDLLIRGYRNDLVENDMFPLDRDLSSDTLRLKFQTAWEKGKTLLDECAHAKLTG